MKEVGGNKIIWICWYVIFILIFIKSLGQGKSTVLDGIYQPEHIPAKTPIEYGSGGPYGGPIWREADIIWSKRIWRRIDLREKPNHVLFFPTAKPNQGVRPLWDILKEAIVKEGTVTAYSPGILKDDDQFTTPMTPQEVLQLLVKKDTQYVTDPTTGETEMKVVDKEITPSEIKWYDLKEDWFFDKQRSVLDVKIIGICPLKERYDEVTGEFKGTDPLFWIYFPELRRVIAKIKVYNPANDAMSISFDDFFWKRKFSSYIVKESNVYDRAIREYATGIDAILEAERIKNSIFDFEQGLWQY